jgi:hypothetical protein
MNHELEEKLWNAGKKCQKYSEQEWKDMIDDVLKDFKSFLRQDFQLDPEFVNFITDPVNPSFSRWIWMEEKEELSFSIGWSALAFGELCFNEKGEENFNVGISLFVLDDHNNRLCLKTGESVVRFSFQRESNGKGLWVNLGWCHNESAV